MFIFELALEMGMPVREMLSRMTYVELQEWKAYSKMRAIMREKAKKK